MKRLLMGFATCTLIMTSCSKNDVIENIADGQTQLTFSLALSKQTITRVGELDNSTLKVEASEGNGVALYAYQCSATDVWTSWYADNVWYANSKWQIGSIRFANTAASKYITFFPEGYVSKCANFSDANFADIFPKFVCTIPIDNDSQKDLIAGITDVAANKKEITLAMRHILSQVNFGVKGYKGAFIQIENIQIHDVFNKATYKYNKEASGTTDIIGGWDSYISFTAGSDENKYTYLGKYETIPATATTGHKYIFGDGGNWGAGSSSTDVWYIDRENKWVYGSAVKSEDRMTNSLMLMPQNFTIASASNENAYVTFDYKIWDTGSDGKGKNAGYAAGSSDFWAKGRFKLNFEKEGGTYANKWEQNYRYVYIIDFENFIEDSKLDFTVDVETYPWLNYNDPSDGIVGVPVVGIPTNTQLNALNNGGIWYVATRSTTPPSGAKVQLVQGQIWNWTDYTFTGLKSAGQLLNINFSEVLFNSRTITINVGSGYKIYIGSNETAGQSITVNGTNQDITIEKI